MYRIVITCDDAKIDEIVVTHDPVSIGRTSDNDIRIEDTTVSGHHARFVTEDGIVYIEDLDSTNGTYVNGAPVAERALSEGDVIVIGTHKLRYQPMEEETTSGLPEPTQQLDRREIEQLLAAADARRAGTGLASAGRALNWIAQDEDGIWWGFEHEPHQGGRGWVDDKSGLRIRLKEERLNPNWRTTLQKL